MWVVVEVVDIPLSLSHVKRISSKHDTMVMTSTAGQQIMRRFLCTGT